MHDLGAVRSSDRRARRWRGWAGVAWTGVGLSLGATLVWTLAVASVALAWAPGRDPWVALAAALVLAAVGALPAIATAIGLGLVARWLWDREVFEELVQYDRGLVHRTPDREIVGRWEALTEVRTPIGPGTVLLTFEDAPELRLEDLHGVDGIRARAIAESLVRHTAEIRTRIRLGQTVELGRVRLDPEGVRGFGLAQPVRWTEIAGFRLDDEGRLRLIRHDGDAGLIGPPWAELPNASAFLEVAAGLRQAARAAA